MLKKQIFHFSFFIFHFLFVPLHPIYDFHRELGLRLSIVQACLTLLSACTRFMPEQ